MSFRDEFLRLLREDAGFRGEVMRLLGINDVNASLARLIESVNALTNAVNTLIKEETETRSEIKTLQEGQNKLWEEVKAIREENSKIWLEIKAMRKNYENAWIITRQLRSGVNIVSKYLDKLLERDVRHYLPVWIKDKLGFNVDKLKRVVVENVGGFDGYVEVNDWIIVVEVKSTLRVRDANDFINRLARLKVIKANKRITAVLAYVNDVKETAEAIKVLKAYDVKVLKHHGEDDFEEVT
ncbi:hypothetical protein [Caldivirga maquilingensis]|uniref:PaREP7 n=1 Tax=Caldivirga maquilingensis (strain ATCC 700844 / DSM 13496 / JCM 10307 / IC-167) TaxID=397948 RepID=A8M8Y2_CALMQ|nr:hypothetical protein [Caldivirga maquilingensis]ABW02201.1 hypothetical protein Cmaq_1375 [Caldivirga maquilingensis IC-167]